VPGVVPGVVPKQQSERRWWNEFPLSIYMVGRKLSDFRHCSTFLEFGGRCTHPPPSSKETMKTRS